MILAAKLAYIGVVCLSVVSCSNLVTDPTGPEQISNHEKPSFWSTLFGSFKGKHNPESNYAEEYNDIDYDPESIDRMVPKPAASSYTSTSSNSPGKTSPAISALTLLGFLYFLGYIQDVLQGNSVRRKRDTTGGQGEIESRVESYLSSIEGVIDTLEDFFPTAYFSNRKFLASERSMDGKSVISSSVDDQKGTEKSNKVSGQPGNDKASDRSIKIPAAESIDNIVNFFGSLLEKIPKIFGFTMKKAFIPTTEVPQRKFIKSERSMDGKTDTSGSVKDHEGAEESNVVPGKLENDKASGRSMELRADKIVNFIGSLFGKIPRILGFTKKKKASRRDDYQISNLEADSADPGFWSMFGSKVGQIATLMDFLDNPSPARIGKTNWEEERDDVEDDELIAKPTELDAEDRSFLVPYGDIENRNFVAPQRFNGGQRSRQKRFTDEMNAWYSEAGQEKHRASEANGANAQILGLMFNLLKGALTS